jgi:ribulose-5-phosphate 4-epimerase/fuculose-1-phosphate aldolase
MSNELIEKLVMANRILDKTGLTVPFGHVSVRAPGTDRLLISRAIAPGLVTNEDLLVVDFNGKVLEGKGKWHGETWIHICIYQSRPEVQGIVHIHSLYVTSLATAEATFLPGTVFGFPFAGSKVYKKAGLINSRKRGEEMTSLMGKETAVLMKGHGGSVAGSSLEEATVKAVMMEEAAKIQLLAGLAGGAKAYAEDELADFKHELENLAVQNDRPAGLFERTWAYYEAKVNESKR